MRFQIERKRKGLQIRMLFLRIQIRNPQKIQINANPGTRSTTSPYLKLYYYQMPFKNQIDQFLLQAFCSLCWSLHADSREKVYTDLYTWWVKKSHCKKFRAIDQIFIIIFKLLMIEFVDNNCMNKDMCLILIVVILRNRIPL